MQKKIIVALDRGSDRSRMDGRLFDLQFELEKMACKRSSIGRELHVLQRSSEKEKDPAHIGGELFQEGRFEEAIPHLIAASGHYSDPDFPQMLGVAYLRQREPDYDAAVEALFGALNASHAVIYGEVANNIYKDLGSVFEAVGHTEAYELCRQITDILDEDSEAQISDLHLRGLQGQLVTMAFSQPLAPQRQAPKAPLPADTLG